MKNGGMVLTRREAVGLACVALSSAVLAGSPVTALAATASTTATTATAVTVPRTGKIPVALEETGRTVSEDGGSVTLEVEATNNGDRGYVLVRADVKFFDSDGFAIHTGEVELAGWLDAGRTASFRVTVPVPEGVSTLLLGSPTHAETGEVWDFPDYGLRLAVASVEPAEGGCRVSAYLENYSDAATYSRMSVSVEALDGDGHAVGSGIVGVLGESDEPLPSGETRGIAGFVPFDGAASLLVSGIASVERFDPRRVSHEYSFQTVEFGMWTKGASDELIPEPLEWLVIAQKGSRKLLLSKYAIDCRPYNDRYENTTWSDCTLRAWLNDEFLSTAFTPEEQGRIAEYLVHNDDNPDVGIEGGPDTVDRVFCLSVGEVQEYFGIDSWDVNREPCEDLVAFPTDRAVANGAWVYERTGGCYWWLRSPGYFPDQAVYILGDGSIFPSGYFVGYGIVGVRPALWVSDI